MSILTYVPYVNTMAFALLGNLISQEKCREGYENKSLRCYKKCTDQQVDVGLMCRDKCREGYKDVAGVCWFDKCPSGQEKQGTLCYQKCRGNEKQIGCCLCREKCRSGYNEVLGVCWKGLRSYTPKTRTRTSDAKLASYTPSTKAKQSYTPTTSTPLTSISNSIKILFFVFLGMVTLLAIGIIKFIISLVRSVGK